MAKMNAPFPLDKILQSALEEAQKEDPNATTAFLGHVLLAIFNRSKILERDYKQSYKEKKLGFCSHTN